MLPPPLHQLDYIIPHQASQRSSRPQSSFLVVHRRTRLSTQLEAMATVSEEIENLVISVVQKIGISKPRLEFSEASATGDNYVGKLYRVVVKDEDNETPELYLVVKTAPANKERRELFRIDVFFQNEAQVYQDVLPALAECYKQKGLLDKDAPFPSTAKVYACVTSSDGCDVIVMEDMRQRGFVMADRKIGINEAQCRLVLRELARLHAASLALQKQNPELHDDLVNRLTENVFIERKEKDDTRLKQLCERCRKLIEKRFPEGTEARAKFEVFAENFSTTMRSFLKKDSKLLCITHGDTWTNNFLFKYDEETSKPIDVCLLDFQITRVASPVLDLSYLLFTSTSKALRDAHYDDLLRYYHENLVGHLNDLGVNGDERVPWELFEEEVRKYSGYGWGMAMLVVPLFLADKSDIVDADTITDLKSATLLKNDDVAVKPANEKKMSDVLEDVLRLGYL